MQAAVDRGQEMKSVCFDDSPGGALAEYPFLAGQKFREGGMLSSWRKESANIYAKATEAVLARLKTSSGRGRSQASGRWSVMEQRLFEKFKAMRCAHSELLSAASPP